MSYTDENIAQCEACACIMDVSMMQPFSNVECPECQTHNRVNVNVGNYVLRKRQGVGGMSLVFGAVDVNLGREVAIKILNESYSMDAKRIEQFEQEAQITAAITHPHVVRVYTVGQAYKRFYIAMELVPGGSLEEKMNTEGALDEKHVLRWGREVCEGLSAANEAGLIHRDIKPGNILFDAEGHVKIVDFGLALVTQGGKAQAEEIWATPYYVPPETLDVLEEDFRSDIYALGASLFHALYGKPPFDTESRSTSELKQIKMNLPSLKECAPAVSNATCAVIDKAMSFDPEDRYRSYKEFIDDLYRAEMILDNPELEELEASNSLKRQRRRKAKQLKIYGSVAAGVLIAGGALAAVLMMKGEGTDVTDSSAPTVEELEGISGSDDGGASGRRLTAAINNARSALRAGKTEKAAKFYGEISRDNRLPLNSIMWGGLQSYIMNYLNGNTMDSRTKLTGLDNLYQDKRKKNQAFEPNDLTQVFAENLSPFRQMKPVSSEEFETISNEAVALVAFAAALKNWEEGYSSEALEILSRVETYVESKDLAVSEELKFYDSLIPNYRSDYELMKPYLEVFVPADESEIESRENELTEAKEKLKTKGRAEENFKEWLSQLDIYSNRFAYEREQQEEENEAKQKNSPLPIVYATWDDVYAKLEPELEKGDFIKARDLLWSTKFESRTEKQKKRTLIYLCGQANDYKKTLNKSLGNGVVNAPIKLKNGKNFTSFTGVNTKGVTIKDGNALLAVSWGEMDPISVIDLVKISLSEKNIKQFEKNRRLEQAIAYAYLSGARDKAAIGAESLSKASPAFQKRWSKHMETLAK